MSRKTDSSRPTVIAGNWKMYKTIAEALDFVETLAPLIGKSQAAVYLAVPFTAIRPAAHRVEELGAPITIGAQNMNDATEGAFTGEIAARMLSEAGARFVILGHSERRHLFDESNAFINKKVKRALEDSLQPVLCIGETLAEREAGETERLLKEQLTGSLEGISVEELSKMIIAYEPVWAIGTGKVARPEDAEAAQHFVRGVIAETWGEEVAERVPILYGGSVKPENADELLAQPDVDGLLVGGASLSADAFSKIIIG
ncbi:MAG: triose-phosphate isomerase [Chlamydiales bacterium]|nr:triose-phosphate isomerase [Chlamydiales bacterium]